MKKTLLCFALLCSMGLLLEGTGPRSAAMAAENEAVCTNGVFIGRETDGVVAWKGIPFAQPPVGPLRWKAPVAPAASGERREAFNFANSPLQAASASTLFSGQSEDCLHLNVWRSGGASSELKPVMVWIYGGAFKAGGASNPMYSGQDFVSAHKDVIYVSIDYRLGLMGFVDFSDVPGGSDFPDSPNLGLLDQLQALKWLRENIQAFGGDPNNITLFGQSAGAASISLLMTMPEAKGLFRRAIIESGAVSQTAAKEDCAELTKRLLALTGASNMAELMALSQKDLKDAVEALWGYTNFPQRDGRILARDIYSAFAERSGGFDLLIGTNADELRYWITAMGGVEPYKDFVSMAYSQIVEGIGRVSSADQARAQDFVALQTEEEPAWAMTEFMNDLLFRGPAVAQAQSHTGATYMYYWKYPSGFPNFGACHGAEMPYVLNLTLHALAPAINRDLAAKVQALWVNFAKTGNPSTPSIAWPRYDAQTRSTLIIDEEITTQNAPLDAQRELIMPLLKYGISGQELINATDSQQPQEEDAGPAPEPASSDTAPSEPEPSGSAPSDTGSSSGCDMGTAGLICLLPLLGMRMSFYIRRDPRRPTI